jgi:hypothetical protein
VPKTMQSVERLFDIHKGHQLALNRVERVPDGRNAVAYVARSHRNNGITAWVREIDGLQPANAGDISVCLRSRNHSLAAFVQPRRFYTTYHVAILTPKSPMTIQEKLWWCLCLRANRFRFHFGRQANRTIGSLALPDGVPAWAAALKLPSHGSDEIGDAGVAVDTSSWVNFKLLDMFSMHAGEHTTRRNLGHGKTPFVSASAWNNGITAKVAVPPNWSGGQITVANNGSIGAAFYQPRSFTASRDVTVLQPKMPLSAAAALFICTLLRKESKRFNYARKWTSGRMRESTVRLPARASEPDIQTMEQFMKNLHLGWAL